ncbi:lipoate--protein ligase family protein [bacterium]|nr:lipoate--protein ligase family protein [bacterium]
MKSKKWRLIQTGFSDLYNNMAIDEALLMEHYRGNTLPTLRIYGWNPPAFSLGYFQDVRQELDIERCTRQGINFVRRITGGGIIFHHQEVTYSFICSREEMEMLPGVKGSYKTICSFLINMYKKLGIEAYFAVEGKVEGEKLGKPSSFCFASKEEYDILINGKKIGGNAQKRRKGLIFQHGSIPLKLNIDEVTPFLKKKSGRIKKRICSLSEVMGKEVSFNEIQLKLIESFRETFSVNLREEELSFEEKKLAQDLRETKYSGEEWNVYRKTV